MDGAANHVGDFPVRNSAEQREQLFGPADSVGIEGRNPQNIASSFNRACRPAELASEFLVGHGSHFCFVATSPPLRQRSRRVNAELESPVFYCLKRALEPPSELFVRVLAEELVLV